MLTIPEIREDDAVKEWLDNYESENTINGYLGGMKKYCNMIGKTPTELIDEAIEESGQIIPKRKYLKYLKKFYTFLKKGGDGQKALSEKSVNFYMNSIISFYQYHEIEIPNPKKVKVKSPKTKNGDVPTVEQIRDVLEAATPMIRAYILAATSSGLSVSDICNLKIKDIQNVDENDITTLKLKRQKTDVDFYTFFSPEATKAIRQYISVRNGKGTLHGARAKNWQIKHRINSDEDFLFVKENIRGKKYFELLEKKKFKEAEKFRKMTPYNFEDAFRYLSKRLSMETGKGEYNTIRTHNFRKYFITTMTDLGMGIMDVHFLAGKEPPAGFAPYHKPDGFRDNAILEWKDRYFDCLNSLMFKERVTDVTRDKYKKLEAEFNEFKIESKIKMIEIEMVTVVKPYQIEIKDYEYRINEAQEYVKYGRKPDERLFKKGEMVDLDENEIENYKNLIKKWEGEIRRLEYEIEQTKEPYLAEIEELKEKSETGE